MVSGMKTFILDPGHGGIIDNTPVTPGKRYQHPDRPLFVEGVWNRLLSAAIVKKGIESCCRSRHTEPSIICPYHNSADIPLSTRVSEYNRILPAGVLSIHCNAAQYPNSGTGIEIWIPPLGHPYLPRCLQLSQLVQKTLRGFPLKFRGIKQSSALYILRNTRAPVALLECGFMDNLTDHDFLVDSVQAYADALYSAITEYLEVT